MEVSWTSITIMEFLCCCELAQMSCYGFLVAKWALLVAVTVEVAEALPIAGVMLRL